MVWPFLVFLPFLWLFLLKPFFLHIRSFYLFRWLPSCPWQDLLFGPDLSVELKIFISNHQLDISTLPYWNCHFPLSICDQPVPCFMFSISTCDHIPQYPRKTSIPVWFFFFCHIFQVQSTTKVHETHPHLTTSFQLFSSSPSIGSYHLMTPPLSLCLPYWPIHFLYTSGKNLPKMQIWICHSPMWNIFNDTLPYLDIGPFIYIFYYPELFSPSYLSASVNFT